MNIRTISYSLRLPDLQRAQMIKDYDEYGRFAVLNNNFFWIGDVRSSHPSNTQNGYYYARVGDILYVSSRGCDLDRPSESLLKWLLVKLNLRLLKGVQNVT